VAYGQSEWPYLWHSSSLWAEENKFLGFLGVGRNSASQAPIRKAISVIDKYEIGNTINQGFIKRRQRLND